jgi:hypothetical protein
MVVAYLSHLPRKLLHRMAGFLKDEGSYMLPRAEFKPPASLLKQVWPWLDEWLNRVYARAQGKGWKAGGLSQEDNAAAGFLKLLVILRDVFLQDAAILQLSKSFPSYYSIDLAFTNFIFYRVLKPATLAAPSLPA